MKKPHEKGVGLQATPSLAKSVSETTARAGFLTDGLPRRSPAADDDSGTQALLALSPRESFPARWRMISRPRTSGGPGARNFSSEVRGLADQQRRPITVAGPWPTCTAFPLAIERPSRSLEGLSHPSRLIFRRKSMPAIGSCQSTHRTRSIAMHYAVRSLRKPGAAPQRRSSIHQRPSARTNV